MRQCTVVCTNTQHATVVYTAGPDEVDELQQHGVAKHKKPGFTVLAAQKYLPQHSYRDRMNRDTNDYVHMKAVLQKGAVLSNTCQ